MKISELRSMSTEALIDLRTDISRILTSKVAAERKDLQARLDKLQGYDGSVRARGRLAHSFEGRKVVPKYRGPSGETWSGRGLRPKWLSAQIAEGHTVEEFAIVGAAAAGQKSAKKKSTRRQKRARKTGK